MTPFSERKRFLPVLSFMGLCLFVGLFSQGCAGGGTSGTGGGSGITLSGTVSAAGGFTLAATNGAPLSGVRVVALEASTPGAPVEDVTDAAGNFDLLLPAYRARVTLLFESSAFNTAFRLENIPRQASTVNISLEYDDETNEMIEDSVSYEDEGGRPVEDDRQEGADRDGVDSHNDLSGGSGDDGETVTSDLPGEPENDAAQDGLENPDSSDGAEPDGNAPDSGQE